jgi:pullulanase/glycogen debranching enzyme
MFDDSGSNEQRLDMPEAGGYVWHCFLPGIGPGQRYGYRVHGPHDPDAGLRCNPAKLLQDPYAKVLAGQEYCRGWRLGRIPHSVSRTVARPQGTASLRGSY